MGKFNPYDFEYELVHDYPEALHYQKITFNKEKIFTDIIELCFWKETTTWMIYIDTNNLKQFIDETKIHMPESKTLSLFAGTITTNQDFRFLMNKICKSPELLLKMGC